MNVFRRFRDGAIVAALVAIPFFFLKANLAEPGEASWLDEVVLKVSAPIQYVATQVARGASSVLEEYVFLVEVKADNESVRSENDRLRHRVRDLRSQADENVRLRGLLRLREHVGGEALTAQVIGKEVSDVFRVNRIRLDRGQRDLVRPGMAVLSAEGLVGQIRRTESRYSDVLLTVDRTSAIDVLIQRSGARGMLRGTGEDGRYLCRIQYLEREEDVEVGDEIHTSGYGQRFPASILVGRVSNVVRQEFGLYQEVEVIPAVNFSNLEEVLVLTAGPNQQAALDTSPSEDEASQ